MKLNKRDKKAQVGQNETGAVVTPPTAKSTAQPMAEASSVDLSGEGERTPIHLYLREIGQIPLLTAPEEITLAKRIKRGDKKAREDMIKANLRLVVKIARDYEGYGVPLLDLISEGNIGLMKAVERFDPSKGAKFSTYGAWWIKQAIRRALSNQSKTIRIPVHIIEKISELRRITQKLAEELGRDPSEDELADELNVDASRIRQYLRASQSATSLDAPVNSDEEGGNRVADFVADERAQTPAQELEAQAQLDALRDLIEGLEAREAAILRRRFGLDGIEEQTLEEIGLDYGVTRERIRQIECVALRKLRKAMNKLEAQHFPA
jgi:RNA polymerase primary sigma factor